MLSLIAMWGKGLGLTKRVEFSLITRPFFFCFDFLRVVFVHCNFSSGLFFEMEMGGRRGGEDKCVLC